MKDVARVVLMHGVILVSKMLRKTSEFFRCLPRREEILHWLLGADLVCVFF